MKFVYQIILIFIFILATTAQEEKNTFVAKDLGISMELPSFFSDAKAQSIANFFLPPSNGFAANINIMKQNYTLSMENYAKSSKAQFKQLNFTIIQEIANENEVIYEYKGQFNGLSLHFYVRAIKKNQHIFLVTATALELDWEKQQADLKKAVNSFQHSKKVPSKSPSNAKKQPEESIKKGGEEQSNIDK